MSALVDSTPQPFNLDAILQEFNVQQETTSTKTTDDDLAISRVRESLGLGRSLFRRKEQNDEESPTAEQVMKEMSPDGDDEPQDKSSKPRRRILDSDDDDDQGIPTSKPSARQSPPIPSPSQNDSDDDDDKSTHAADNLDSDDEFSPATFLANFRKARLEALSAKRAAETRTEKEEDPTESAPSERSVSPVRSVSQSPATNGRKPKARKASKKALDEMQRETQRMARNMGLRPEIKTSKKIEMSTIFAKFGFVPPNSTATDETTVVDPTSSPEHIIEHRVTETPAPPAEPSKVRIDPQTPIQPPKDVQMVDSDSEFGSDDSLPSPSKLAASIAAYKKAHAAPKKSPTPRKVHFTLPPAASSSDSDSDVEILPPPSRLSTHLATPDRKRVKRANLIRSLANIKSPVKTRSPGRMTQKELDVTLSREAAVQSAQKREERRAELKKLGIDVEKVVEKRDLLEEAREEARRIREEEGGEESDEEYVDQEDNDADIDDDSGDDAMESGEEEEADEESGDEEMEESGDEISDDAPTKKKPRAVIISDDEDDFVESSVAIPASTIASQPNIPNLADLRPNDDVSLTQFFKPTQMSGSTESTTQMPKGNSQSGGTGLTQFFMSTAMDDEAPLSGEDSAHNRMELLRQKAGQGIVDLGEESIGFPGVEHPVISSLPTESPHRATSDTEASPIRRRILKRRINTKDKPSNLPQETSEEFKRAKKALVEEQAEESEDDYAAWGSGDESENENMDGVVEGLIDDNTKIKKNTEREVARLYMEGELERDEKFVHGLMHDLQNGGLRRRRNGGLEMGDWDSDDDDDDAEERRQRWELRRDEMKRRMLEDENLGKLGIPTLRTHLTEAANPKTQAFLNAISSTSLNFDDEPDFLGEGEIIEDRKAGNAARNLPSSIPIGDSQSQSQDHTQDSAEIQVPATNSGNLPCHERDRLVIDELTQIEDSQRMLLDDISLSEASDSEIDEEDTVTFATDKVYTGFIDRAAQKRAARTVSESANRFAFKAVAAASPARVKRTAVSVIEADDESTRKKIMKEVVGSKTVKRKAWGAARGRGAVTFRASGGRGKENVGGQAKKKGNADAEKRRRDMLILMDSQNSFC